MKITSHIPTEEWWANLPAGEKDFIRALMGMIKGAKRSQVPEVAQAAQKWESGISCFIKVRLKNAKKRKASRRTVLAPLQDQPTIRVQCAGLTWSTPHDEVTTTA